MNATVNRGARRRVTLAGILAVLFQAILFGWHHHALPLSSRGAQPVIHRSTAAPLFPASDEDHCDICQALHHLTAAPADIVAALPPPAAGATVRHPDPVRADRDRRRVFEARAPPRA